MIVPKGDGVRGPLWSCLFLQVFFPSPCWRRRRRASPTNRQSTAQDWWSSRRCCVSDRRNQVLRLFCRLLLEESTRIHNSMISLEDFQHDLASYKAHGIVRGRRKTCPLQLTAAPVLALRPSGWHSADWSTLLLFYSSGVNLVDDRRVGGGSWYSNDHRRLI